MMDSKNFVR